MGDRADNFSGEDDPCNEVNTSELRSAIDSILDHSFGEGENLKSDTEMENEPPLPDACEIKLPKSVKDKDIPQTNDTVSIPEPLPSSAQSPVFSARDEPLSDPVEAPELEKFSGDRSTNSDSESSRKSRSPPKLELENISSKRAYEPDILKKKRKRLQESESKELVKKEILRLKKVDDNPTLFLPEGWHFYASKRITGSSEGHLDLYYYTPPPHVQKIRSRAELLVYMKNYGLNYDPMKFFRKQEVFPLLEKGVLKYFNSRIIIPSSYDQPYGYKPSLDTVGPKNKAMKLVKKTGKKVKRTEIVKNEMVKSEEKKQSRTFKKTIKRKRTSYSLRQKLQETSLPTIKKEPVSPKRVKKLRERNSIVKPTVNCRLLRSSAVQSPASTVEKEDGALDSVPDDPMEEPVRIQKRPKFVRSPYFSPNVIVPSQPKSLAGLRREKNTGDVPPRSPFNLIQEDLFHDPWQLLIATIFLNSTSGKVAIPLTLEFLKRWPTPQKACQAKLYDILDVIEPLGFGRTRAAIIIRFSHEFLNKDWKLPNELYGIGKYGTDSYKIFCMKNEWKRVESDDPMLMMYLNWRRATEHLRKRFLNSPGDLSAGDPDDFSYNQQESKMSH